jgi:hypothetical protein
MYVEVFEWRMLVNVDFNLTFKLQCESRIFQKHKTYWNGRSHLIPESIHSRRARSQEVSRVGAGHAL